MKNQNHHSIEIKNPPKTTPPNISQGVHSVSLLAQVSTLAWNLVIPIVGGVLLGSYLDNRYGNSITWTLSLLVLGVMIAFSNLYNLYMEHGQNAVDRNQSKDGHKVTHDQEE
jgi:F0F1-type ATP synthase assembly protein I